MKDERTVECTIEDETGKGGGETSSITKLQHLQSLSGFRRLGSDDSQSADSKPWTPNKFEE